MPDKRILGFDFGMKRIGVAVGQSLLQFARPLTRLKANSGIPIWSEVHNYIKEWNVNILVVGVPVDMEGKQQFTTVAAKQFAQQLRDRFALPVYEVDERLSTVEARQQLFESGGYRRLQDADVDSVAAKLIVEQWMRDQKKNSNE